jgi:hypothetical protein
MKSLRVLVLLGVLTAPILVQAQQRQPEVRARVVDQFGNTRHDLPSVRVDRDGRAKVVDAFGNTRHDLPSVKVDRDGRARVVDQFGNTRYDLPSARTNRPKP